MVSSVPTLLLVEDDEVFSSLLSRALINAGFAVKHAYTLDQATAISSTSELTHAVLDLKLADETTLDFIPFLCKSHAGINILMLTGYASIATAVEAVKRGANNYLQKPADINAILQSLEVVLQNPEDSISTSDTLSVQRMEWEHIQTVLARNDGNISATARELNMHRRTLQRKLQKRPVKK